jgi:hypothetical protein
MQLGASYIDDEGRRAPPWEITVTAGEGLLSHWPSIRRVLVEGIVNSVVVMVVSRNHE